MKEKIMNKERKFINSLHNSTKRNFLQRMLDDKAFCMKVAKRYAKDYWDGDRRYGYGGYKYIKGRWSNVAKKLISTYKLKSGSSILDIGCGKGFLLKEIIEINPEIEVCGIDISSYAIKKSHNDIKKKIFKFDVRKKLPFKKNQFDLAISLGTLHNFHIFELKQILKNISSISKSNYIMVESYRNNQELVNLQCWALTCNSFFNTKEWLHIFKEYGYYGDYEFIYFK